MSLELRRLTTSYLDDPCRSEHPETKLESTLVSCSFPGRVEGLTWHFPFSKYFNDHLNNKTTLNFRIPPSAILIWFVPINILKEKHQKSITRGINALIFACLCMSSTFLKLINLWQMDVTWPTLGHDFEKQKPVASTQETYSISLSQTLRL